MLISVRLVIIISRLMCALSVAQVSTSRMFTAPSADSLVAVLCALHVIL